MYGDATRKVGRHCFIFPVVVSKPTTWFCNADQVARSVRVVCSTFSTAAVPFLPVRSVEFRARVDGFHPCSVCEQLLDGARILA